MNKFASITKPLVWFMALSLAAVVAGCGGNSTPASSTKAITAYSINVATGIVATGVINETAKTIAVSVPSGTALTALVATFTTTGSSVKVGTLAQTSGTTPNNFTASKAYIVTAADGSTATYTVTVTVASITAKAITAYSLAGYTGAVIETAKTIVVTVPNGTAVTAMVATFTTTGASVKVGTVAQTSGTTANNFTSSVAYVVTAGDGSTATYNVTVTSSSAAKAITAYSLAGVAGAITGTVSPYAIAVTVPNGTVVTALAATFTSTGASVKVGTVAQTSGTTQNNFTTPVAYVVTALDNTTATYNVTVTAAAANPTPPTLGEAGRFVIFAPAAITTTGITAISNGDIGISPAARSLITGFTANGPAGDFTELTGLTTPSMPSTSYAPADANPAPFPYPLHFSTPVIGAPWTTSGAMLTQASNDLGVADTFLAANPNPGAPSQACAAELGTLTLTRGVYVNAGNVGITTGTLSLDAQGDPNAVFIFNIGGTLSTGAPGGSIVLVNGAQAKNVYWRTAGITTIGAGTSFSGNVFAQTQVNVLSGVQITGSLFAVTDRVTLIADTVTKAP